MEIYEIKKKYLNQGRPEKDRCNPRRSYQIKQEDQRS
jgi:hypothetical protein